MGTVWQAYDEVLGRDVAVKEILLPPGLDETELAAVRGRAMREARAAAQVRHPAIVTIHDVVTQDEHPWIVMDLVRAPSLSDRLAEFGRLSMAESARVGAVLAQALDAVHRHGIVHRDVKPANVLLADDGEVVLTDFGIAVIEGDARFTRTGLLIGTLVPRRDRRGGVERQIHTPVAVRPARSTDQRITRPRPGRPTERPNGRDSIGATGSLPTR
ncbi:serine/threonine protein kinase [Spirillospora sp. NBC_00431]